MNLALVRWSDPAMKNTFPKIVRPLLAGLLLLAGSAAVSAVMHKAELLFKRMFANLQLKDIEFQVILLKEYLQFKEFKKQEN